MPSPALGTPASAYPQESTAKNGAALLFLAFGVVYVFWGSTYLAMRIGIESFPPLLLPGSRHLLVGLILYPLLRWKTGERPTIAQWKTAAMTGTLLLFFGNGGVCYAEQTVPSGIAALLVATVSLWMVIVDWLRPGGVRPGARVIAGIILGFLGLALLVGPAHLGGSGRVNPTGAAVLIVAAFAWACGSVFSKHGALPHSPMLGVAMQGLAGGTVLWVAGLLTGEGRSLHWAAISARSWLALAYLVLFGSVLGFTAYLYILRKSTAARVGTYALVNPVVALCLGWLFAKETVSLRTLAAAAIILSSVFLVITAPARMAEPEPLIPAGGEAD